MGRVLARTRGEGVRVFCVEQKRKSIVAPVRLSFSVGSIPSRPPCFARAKPLAHVPPRAHAHHVLAVRAAGGPPTRHKEKKRRLPLPPPHPLPPATPLKMNFDEATLTAKLAALTPSQASIEALAGWCLFYRADADRVCSTWAQAYDSAPSDAHRLALLYLANDVLQKSRLNKGPEYLDAFIAPLPPRLRALASSTSDPRSAASAARLLAVMRERAVFGSVTGKVLGGGGGGGTKRAAAENDDEPEPPLPRRKRGARSDLAPAQTALAAAAAVSLERGWRA